ncbi:MAG: ABC transporter permease [Proteobacteria bacterium]|nr:ABC transporter permease [Pseudomonadota bacterium]NDG28074.1 ABC transporter permease [Pseudomonadota bacterium]
MNQKLKKIGLPICAFVAMITLWEFAARIKWINPFILPEPSQILNSLIQDKVELWSALGVTAFSVTISFGLSVVLGISTAILLFTSETVLYAFYPYTIFFQTVPIIAIAPLLVIWFGYGIPAVVASGFIVSVFPVIASTLTGLLSADPALKDLFRLYGATRMQALVKLYLPGSLPFVMNGLRISGGLAVIGAIVGEFLGGVGIGSIIDVARAQQRIDKVFAAVLLASGLGLLLIKLIDLTSYVLLKNWHPSEGSEE